MASFNVTCTSTPTILIFPIELALASGVSRLSLWVLSLNIPNLSIRTVRWPLSAATSVQLVTRLADGRAPQARTSARRRPLKRSSPASTSRCWVRTERPAAARVGPAASADLAAAGSRRSFSLCPSPAGCVDTRLRSSCSSVVLPCVLSQVGVRPVSSRGRPVLCYRDLPTAQPVVRG